MSDVVPPRPHGRKLKVKTGCITCRIRKVKCDEAKPFCKRCTNTGRKCDGYMPPPTIAAPKKTSLVVRSPKQALQQPDAHADLVLSGVLGTDEEYRSLDFFFRRTAPAVSGAFDTGFWTYLLPQLSHSEDAIRHSLLAVGSLHAQYESRTTRGHKDGISSQIFPIQQYNRAISILKSQLSGTEVSIEVTLVCCVLFVCLECLRGNGYVALNHLHNGLTILSSALAKEKNSQRAGSYRFGSDFMKKHLHEIFSRLNAQLSLMGKSSFDINGPSTEMSTFEVPATFSNLSDAKATLDILCTAALRLGQATLTWKYTSMPTANVLEEQLNLLTQFLQWLRSFENCEAELHVADQRGPLLLRIQYNATYIWLSTCLMSNETVFDGFQTEFENIVTGGQSVAKFPNTASFFALDLALIPPLYMTAIKCRRPWIRRKAIELLYAIPGREGTWDAQVHAKIAERIVAIEEQALEDLDGMPAEEFRIKNADIVSDIDVDPVVQHVTFFTKPNGLDADWVIWKEEIVM